MRFRTSWYKEMPKTGQFDIDPGNSNSVGLVIETMPEADPVEAKN